VRIREQLHQLRELGASGLKAGFEAEAQDLDDVVRMSTMDPALPLTVKIGGCEARTDLRNLVDWGIVRIVSPMIESPFAVKKTMEAAVATVGDDLSQLTISLNLESVAAHVARREILGCDAARVVAKVNVGRTDLAASIGLPVESHAVREMTCDFLDDARRAGKGTGVGGNITPTVIEDLLSACGAEEFETRHVIFETARVRDASAAVRAALDFELALIEWLEAPRARRLREAEGRAKALRGRLGLDPQRRG
jgi:hypothetical protein